MNSDLRWLQAGYWVPAFADFAVAIQVLSPEPMGVTGYVYPMGLMAAVAFSWGILLLIASREPLDRRWVLPPTMLVVALLGGVALHAGSAGIISVSRAIAAAIASAAVLTVMTLGYRRSAAVP